MPGGCGMTKDIFDRWQGCHSDIVGVDQIVIEGPFKSVKLEGFCNTLVTVSPIGADHSVNSGRMLRLAPSHVAFLL